MRNNCFFWAHVEYVRRKTLWLLAGRPKAHTPVIYLRPSDLAPDWVPHWSVAYLDRYTYQLSEIVSYKPTDHAPVPWWKVWKTLFFQGTISYGDHPATEDPP